MSWQAICGELSGSHTHHKVVLEVRLPAVAPAILCLCFCWLACSIPSETQAEEIVKTPLVHLELTIDSVVQRPASSSLPDYATARIDRILSPDADSRSSRTGTVASQNTAGLARGVVIALTSLYSFGPATVEFRPEPKPDRQSPAISNDSSESLQDPDVRQDGIRHYSIRSTLVEQITEIRLPGLSPGTKVDAKISYHGAQQGTMGIYRVLSMPFEAPRSGRKEGN